MRSFLIVLISVCVLGLGFGAYWMLAGGGGATDTGPARANARRVATTLPAASHSRVGPGKEPYVERFDQNTGELASRFRAARYEPQKGGRWHVEQPEAEFFLHNGQVMRIIGEKGTVNVEESSGDFASMRQMPRGGELQNVRILLLPSLGATRPTMTLSMKNASFDNETFRISTEAYRDGDRTVPADRVHVKVRGDDYEFDGYGLRLQYNEIDRRLEYLRISHGERLLIKSPSKFMKGKALGTKQENEQASMGMSAWQTVASSPSLLDLLPTRAIAGVRLVATDATAAGEAVKAPKKSKKPSDDPLDAPVVAREEPVYRAVFKDQVNITQSGKPMAVAQDLIVDFLNKENDSLGGVVGGEGPTTRPRRSTTRPATRPATTRPAQVNAAPTTRPARRAATRPTTGPAPEPIEIRWTGPLTITPLPGDRPERIMPGESIVRLVGSSKRPVEVTRATEQGTGTLKAGTLTHWTLDQGVFLEEAPGIAVEMIDSKGGHIVTRSMLFSEKEGTALLHGKSRALLPIADEKDPAKKELMDVAWQERCTLFLAGGGLDDMVLSRADLHGKVAVDHPQLKLNSETLQLHFDDQQQQSQQQPTTNPTTRPGNGKQSTPPLRQLDATGDVHCVIARPDKTSQTLDCQTLKLVTARTPQGQLYARNVVALGQVHAVDPKQDVTAGYVSVSLAAPTTRPATRPAGAGEMMPGEVESLLAHDDVRVKTVDGKTAEADQLVVEIREGQPSATLHGRPAVVTHNKNRLTSDVIQMMSATQQISVPGPGRMQGVQRQEPGQPERPVEVTWEKNMRADGRQNMIEAFGSVVARNIGADGAVNVAKGQQVRLATTRPTTRPAGASAGEGSAAVVSTKKPTTRPTGDLDVMADHQIQSILLYDGAQVTSVLKEIGGERTFHVTSASIQYDKAKQKLTIPQEGKLLFADTRPPAPNATAQAAAQDPFGVRGQTAFEWADSLVYDEAVNQVTMSGSVVIARVEQSRAEAEPMRIEADRVIADLEPPAKTPATRPAPAPTDLLSPRMQL